MAKLCQSQRLLSERISKLLSNTKKTSKSRYSVGYIETRIETLEGYWTLFNTQYNEINQTLTDEEIAEIKFKVHDNFDNTEEIYLELKALLKDCLIELTKKDTQQHPLKNVDDTDTTSIKHTKLPPIPIPSFSGNYNDWMSYRDLFTTLIHNDTGLSKIEKHHYLKSSLKGEAEQLLKHFSLTDSNYEAAWKTLEDRYNNKRIIVNTILNRLLNQNKITTECVRSTKDLLDTTKECLNSLRNLQIDTDSWDAIIVHIVVSKLDMESHKLWEQSLGSSTDIPKFSQLSAYLETRFRSMEMMSTSQITKRKEYTRPPHTQNPTFVKTFVTEEHTTVCTYCNQNHYVCHCKKFAALDVPQRQEFIKKNEICFNCLVKGHRLKDCRQGTSCKKCGRRHHTLLHVTYDNVKATEKEPKKDEAVTLKTETISETNYSAQVLLATALISVPSKYGETHVLRALIDQASQASFITEAAAQLLSLDRTYVDGKIAGISDTSVVTTKSMVKLTLCSTKNQEETLLTTNAYVLKKLSSLLPSQEFSSDTWPRFESLNLADPQFYKPGSIDILLGAEVHAQIILDGLKRHKSLIALNSRLGWIISGRVTQTDSQPHNFVVAHTRMEVDQLLRQFWEIEEYLPHKKAMTAEETQCEEHFKKTHTRDAGRYVVRLPFRDETSPGSNLGDSKPLAIQRLLQLEKRFTRRPEFKEEYCKFLTNYEEQSHMEKVSEEERLKNKNPYYLPHHAVVRESSFSTKLRVVFDGSAQPVKGNSINEELLIGPPLQQDIRDLVTRWRQHKYCLVADIQQMYRQIRISNKDTDYQRILWRKSPDEPIAEYRLRTVTYGTSCAPFLAIRTLHQLAHDERDDFPAEATILMTDLYMDDLLTGASTEEHTVILQKRLTELLSRGGFPLHKWSSNSELVLSVIPECVKNSQSEVNIKVDESIKALGIKWQPKSDNFELKIVMDTNEKIVTKRTVLAAIAKTFDPLGWIAPCVIVLKIFMQKLWLAGLTWDDELTEELKQEWRTCLDNFTHMEPIQLSRWLGMSKSTTKVEIHGFSDASCVAFAAVVYLRVWDCNDVKVALVVAKTKVAPVKQISVPRLELCGAVLLSKLLHDVKTSLNINEDSVFAWTGSTIVLAWLRKSPNTWTTFVANRTTEILNVTNSSQWNHVASENNPADCASRGVSPKELQEAQLWWEGPQFLKQNAEICCSPFVEPKNVIETKTKVSAHLSIEKHEYLSRYSSLLKLIRSTAALLRFIKLCKLKIQKIKATDEPIQNLPKYLTSEELLKATSACIKMSQADSFENEIALLSKNKPLPKSSKLYTINTYLDENNILRVAGRLANADLPHYMKSPIVLMKDCPLAKLIVDDAHKRTLHGGHQLTLNFIRQKYWIVGAKSLVKRIVNQCISCFKQKATPTTPFMGNLPDFRLRPSRPFSTCGVDFAGPFTSKLYPGRCNRSTKLYICLFICTVTKAIHLELVSDLSTSAFLAAFKRFVARRGRCKDIWSDCGTNFVGASRELDLAFKNAKSPLVAEISELLANDNTTWHFIPPRAPHFGGLWESGVKSVKGHLKRVIGQTSLTYEEFYTLLTQVEACVNSRPLTLVSTSLDEPPLTPAHFLVGEPLISVPEEDQANVKLSPLARCHHVQRMVQNLWHRWQSEYLTNLQHRYKWSKHQHDVEIGCVVLVKDDRLPPGKWLLGRVLEKHPGADGITRVVTLKCKDSVFKRPVTKLCPLHLDDA